MSFIQLRTKPLQGMATSEHGTGYEFVGYWMGRREDNGLRGDARTSLSSWISHCPTRVWVHEKEKQCHSASIGKLALIPDAVIELYSHRVSKKKNMTSMRTS